MESKFEILSYQNCNDLKKAINPSSVLIGAVTLLLGLYLAFFVSVSDPTSNLNMLRLAAGWVLAGFGLVTLVFNPRRWVYDPTGSPVGKRSLDFGMEQLPALRRMLKDTGFDDVAINDISKVHIDCYASADHRFVAIQVLQYGALSIIAKTKCAKSENETSKTSLFSLLNSQQFFPMFRRLERIRKLNTK